MSDRLQQIKEAGTVFGQERGRKVHTSGTETRKFLHSFSQQILSELELCDRCWLDSKASGMTEIESLPLCIC